MTSKGLSLAKIIGDDNRIAGEALSADIPIGAFEKSYRYSGDLEINTGALRLYIHKDCTLNEIDLFVGTAPVGSAVTIDLKKNGSSIATPSIADGTTSNIGVAVNVSLVSGDYLTVDITQIGSTTVGSDLYAVLSFK